MYKNPDIAAIRPRNADQSRASILDAAQHLFAIEGYVATGVRDVAQRAGVNSALVGRYFGSKLALFEAALADLLQIAPLIDTERAGFGRHVVGLLVSADGAGPLAMMLRAAADPDARDISVALLQERIVAPLAEWLGEPNGEERAARMNLLWMGFLNCSRLLPLPALSGDGLAPVLRWIAEATQEILDEERLPSSDAG